MKPKQGLFITFEGGEGAGKTTLMSAVFRALAQEGRDVLAVREPGGTALGEGLRNLLLHHKSPIAPHAELCLFLASRAQHLLEVIRPALAAGKIVLCDRFNDSSIVYQGIARGLGAKEVEEMCYFVSQGLVPNLTLYLDIDPALGLARAKKERAQDRIEQEGIAFHTKIREAYLSIQKAYRSRVHLLDASAPADAVFAKALQLIHTQLAAHHV